MNWWHFLSRLPEASVACELSRPELAGLDHRSWRLRGLLLPRRVFLPPQLTHERHKPRHCPDACTSHEARGCSQGNLASTVAFREPSFWVSSRFSSLKFFKIVKKGLTAKGCRLEVPLSSEFEFFFMSNRFSSRRWYYEPWIKISKL